MAEKSAFLRLIEDLQAVYHVELSEESGNEVKGKIRALEASKSKNLELIQEHFDEILVMIQHKRPCVEKLAQLNEDIDRQLAELREQLPAAFRKGA